MFSTAVNDSVRNAPAVKKRKESSVVGISRYVDGISLRLYQKFQCLFKHENHSHFINSGFVFDER